MVNVLSLFSGVGGFDIGLENAGMRTIYQCEWDKHARSVLDRHWPDVPKWGDISTLTGAEILRHGTPPDVVAWGSPCQDMSIAAGAKRVGINGSRSGLFYEGIRIIKELRELTNGRYPRVSIWENVVGALSSNNGADFGQVLYEMDEAGAHFSEWALLDAQYFGIPQRRRRVFLVSVFDSAVAEGCPEPLLPVTESLRRNPKKGKPKKQETSSETFTGSKRNSNIIGSEIVGPLNTSDAKMISNQYIDENKCVVEPVTVAFDTQFGSNAAVFEETSPTIKASQQSPSINSEMMVRRLTPIECERLMGWPDDWTAGNSDTQRYKQCGNGVASPVAQWVGKHVIKAMEEV